MKQPPPIRRQGSQKLLGLSFLAVLLLWAGAAHSQTHKWVRFEFTTPASGGAIHHYEARAVDRNGVPWVPTLRRDTLTSSPAPTPKAAGLRDTVSVYWPISNKVECLFWIVCVGPTAMRSDSSNAVVVRGGVKADTAFCDVSTMTWFRSRPDGFAVLARPLGDNRWQGLPHAPWNLIPASKVPSQSEVSWWDRPGACKDFGFWWNGAVKGGCP